MSDSVFLDGKEYISSKRASELSGYAQDYIGQLARKGLIDAQRVGGLWHINIRSLSEYKSHADTYVPQQPERKEHIETDSLISFDGKDHISASRAAKITGYHPDYVGQLARSGAIISRQVGNRWYIDREGILAHKSEKDRLLGAVQAQSVGLVRSPMAEGIARNNQTQPHEQASLSHQNDAGPFLTYTKDDRDLLPPLASPAAFSGPKEFAKNDFGPEDKGESYAIPIRTVTAYNHAAPKKSQIQAHPKGGMPKKTIHYGIFGRVATAALTVVIVLSVGFATLRNSSIYGAKGNGTSFALDRNVLMASATGALKKVADFLEIYLVKELVYKRGQ